MNRDVNIELQSNEDIQHSFIRRRYQQVASYIHNISTDDSSKCHVYSFPYEFEYFIKLDNYFQGGIFHKVRFLSMCDYTMPFEYNLFQIISEDFPLLKFLYIYQICVHKKDKQNSSTLIIFPYIILLNLKCAHVDYADQLLLRNLEVTFLTDFSL